jgi:hypothetical protein
MKKKKKNLYLHLKHRRPLLPDCLQETLTRVNHVNGVPQNETLEQEEEKEDGEEEEKGEEGEDQHHQQQLVTHAHKNIIHNSILE